MIISDVRTYGIEHLLVICDEVETATEITHFGLDVDETITRPVPEKS